jgi:hypothetical protein
MPQLPSTVPVSGSGPCGNLMIAERRRAAPHRTFILSVALIFTGNDFRTRHVSNNRVCSHSAFCLAHQRGRVRNGKNS